MYSPHCSEEFASFSGHTRSHRHQSPVSGPGTSLNLVREQGLNFVGRPPRVGSVYSIPKRLDAGQK